MQVGKPVLEPVLKRKKDDLKLVPPVVRVGASLKTSKICLKSNKF